MTEYSWPSCIHHPTLCNDHRMQDGWDEGFCCTLPVGHDGPHRDEKMTGESDVLGRSVHDIYEWSYK